MTAPAPVGLARSTLASHTVGTVSPGQEGDDCDACKLARETLAVTALLGVLARERDAARLDLARLRFAVDHPGRACAACAAVPVEVWRAWLTEHGWAWLDKSTPGRWHRSREEWASVVSALRLTRANLDVGSMCTGIPSTTILADLLARAGWTPPEGT